MGHSYLPLSLADAYSRPTRPPSRARTRRSLLATQRQGSGTIDTFGTVGKKFALGGDPCITPLLEEEDLVLRDFRAHFLPNVPNLPLRRATSHLPGPHAAGRSVVVSTTAPPPPPPPHTPTVHHAYRFHPKPPQTLRASQLRRAKVTGKQRSYTGPQNLALRQCTEYREVVGGDGTFQWGVQVASRRRHY